MFGLVRRLFFAWHGRKGQPPWEEAERIVAGALTQLNDRVGHRPIAILETRPRGEPDDHERATQRGHAERPNGDMQGSGRNPACPRYAPVMPVRYARYADPVMQKTELTPILPILLRPSGSGNRCEGNDKRELGAKVFEQFVVCREEVAPNAANGCGPAASLSRASAKG